jgi:hypothetical protein
MRKTLLANLTLGLLVGAAGAAMTSASSKRVPTAQSTTGGLDLHSTTGGLDLMRPADVQLAAFDRSHPQCQLWTNWQKMCSRAGPNGSTFCVTDPERPAAPSEPFCVAPFQSDYSGAEAESHDRFCAPRSAENQRAHPGQCERYQRDRPFNGFHVTARRSPLCRRWVDVRTRRTICVERPGGHHSCGRNERFGDAPLACAEMSERPPCHPDSDGIIQHIEAETITSDVHFSPYTTPVNGLYCQGDRITVTVH